MIVVVASIPSSLPSAPNLYATNLAFILFNFSHRRRKLDISKYPRHKVILFQFPRCPYAPSLSPFALKLETYLRMANIPYQVRVDILSLLEHYYDVMMGAMAFQINRLFRRRSKKTSKLRVTGLCGGNSPVTGEFPSQREMFPFDDVISFVVNSIVTFYHRLSVTFLLFPYLCNISPCPLCPYICIPTKLVPIEGGRCYNRDVGRYIFM